MDTVSHQSRSEPARVLMASNSFGDMVCLLSLLKDKYHTLLAMKGEAVLAIALSPLPTDLILLDAQIAGMNAYEIYRHLRSSRQGASVPVVFLVPPNEIFRGIGNMKSVDYIRKPVSLPVLVTKINKYLGQPTLLNPALELARGFQTRWKPHSDAMRSRADAVIEAMTTLAKMRDSETGKHIARTQQYMRILVRQLREHPRFSETIDDTWTDLLCKSVPLHDLGKIWIPDQILRKPGPLSAEEFKIMQTHTVFGRNAVLHIEQLIANSHLFLHLAREVAGAHHEKWNGTGYPAGMAGEEIPLSARLMAVADVYDALISKRAYKPALEHDEAIVMITRGKGHDFDPDIVDALLAEEDAFKAISTKLTDEEQTPHP